MEELMLKDWIKATLLKPFVLVLVKIEGKLSPWFIYLIGKQTCINKHLTKDGGYKLKHIGNVEIAK